MKVLILFCMIKKCFDRQYYFNTEKINGIPALSSNDLLFKKNIAMLFAIMIRRKYS